MPPAHRELHNSDVKTEQLPPIDDIDAYDGDVVAADSSLIAREYLDELNFMEDKVTIRLQPSTDRNAAMAFPVWVNGKAAEVFRNGRWYEIGYLPVAVNLVVKRKVLEVIVRAKVDTITTQIVGAEMERPDNRIQRFTTPVHSVSVIEDRNPKGAAWMTELMRRAF